MNRMFLSFIYRKYVHYFSCLKLFLVSRSHLLVTFDPAFHSVQTSGLMPGSKMCCQDTADDIISVGKAVDQSARYQKMNTCNKHKE